ncbi:MAG TPA: hypothetical protein EYP98_13590, partial [Planctomycetes bacterium]|nr:hypothetical protein [Planctomycetota bacterium]
MSRSLLAVVGCSFALSLLVLGRDLAAQIVVPPAGQNAQSPQGQNPQGQNPQGPGRRVDRPLPTIGGELFYEGAVQAMSGKPVRSIQVLKPTAAPVGPPGVPPSTAPLDAASSESIVRSLQTRVGQAFEPRKVSADCATLWSERRLVVRAYAEEVDGGIVVTYQIDLEIEIYEDVEFVGLEQIGQDVVNGLIGYFPGRRTTRTEAEAMRKLLLARYRRDGYAFCNIQLIDVPADLGAGADAAPAETGAGTVNRARKTLRILIEEGPKVTVRHVDFVGNRSVPAHPILGLFGTGRYLVRDAHIESDPAGRLFGGGAFSREVLEEDLDRLRLFYRSSGFLEATVDLADVSFAEDRTSVDLSFVVVEGPRYRVRSIKVQHVNPQGGPVGRQPLYPAGEVQAVLKVVVGEFYDNNRLQRDREAIEQFYGKRGHPPVHFPGMRQSPGSGCQVFPPLEIYAETPEVDIIFQVSEGSPKTLRDVVIRGNRFTRDAVIRRRFRVLPGERINMIEVRRALRRIQSTRYFQDPRAGIGPRLQIEPVLDGGKVLRLGAPPRYLLIEN